MLLSQPYSGHDKSRQSLEIYSRLSLSPFGSRFTKDDQHLSCGVNLQGVISVDFRLFMVGERGKENFLLTSVRVMVSSSIE